MAKSKKESESKPAPLLAIRICIGVLAFLLYSNTLSHKFTLDDDFFFLKNKAVAKGVSSIGDFFSHGSMQDFTGQVGMQPYRPVTLLAFAIQKEMTGFKPGPAHFVNVILYAVLCIFIFNLLLKLFRKVSVWIPAMITLLFLFHPVHTEVVASIKSRDELLAALFGIWSLAIFFGNKTENRTWLRISCSAILFALAVFSKESAVAILAFYPLISLLVMNEKVKKVWTHWLPLLAVASLFLVMRDQIVGSSITPAKVNVIDNVLYGANGFAENFATRMEILFIYLRLLFVPLHLTWDYSFNQIPIINLSSPIAWISTVIYTALFVFALTMWRKKKEMSFGILFYFIALAPVSNFFFLFGSTLAERFLFLPSIGFCIAIGFALPTLFKIDVTTFSGSNKIPMIVTIATVLLIFGVITHSRNKDWESNIKILEAGVIDSPNSARAHSGLASEYRIQGETSSDGVIRAENFKNAAVHYREALRILPGNLFSLYNLGLTYQLSGDTINAFKTYQTTLENDPNHEFALNNLGTLYGNRLQYDSAIICLERVVKVQPDKPLYRENLAIFQFFAGNYDVAIGLAQEVIKVAPTVKAYQILSECYRMKGDAVEASKYLELSKQTQ